MKASVSMWPVFLGIFLVLHGLVHLLYAGHSLRLFELRPGLTWPDGSWVFSRLLADESTRLATAAALALAALGLAAGGLGLILRQEWARPAALGATAFSAALFPLLWNGRFEKPDEQGGVGVLINLAVMGIVLVLSRPA